MPVGSERLGFGSEAATTTVDRDGTFTFLNVPDGNYTLLAKSSVMDFTTGSTSMRFPDAPGFPAAGSPSGSTRRAGLWAFSRAMVNPAPLWGRTGGDGRPARHRRSRGPIQPTSQFAVAIVLEPGVTNDGRVTMMAEPADGDPTIGMPSGVVVANDPSLAFSIHGVMTGRYLLRQLKASRSCP